MVEMRRFKILDGFLGIQNGRCGSEKHAFQTFQDPSRQKDPAIKYTKNALKRPVRKTKYLELQYYGCLLHAQTHVSTE